VTREPENESMIQKTGDTESYENNCRVRLVLMITTWELAPPTITRKAKPNQASGKHVFHRATLPWTEDKNLE
jgi:hypothetical protein